jgi:hypothetical protein
MWVLHFRAFAAIARISSRQVRVYRCIQVQSTTYHTCHMIRSKMMGTYSLLTTMTSGTSRRGGPGYDLSTPHPLVQLSSRQIRLLSCLDHGLHLSQMEGSIGRECHTYSCKVFHSVRFWDSRYFQDDAPMHVASLFMFELAHMDFHSRSVCLSLPRLLGAVLSY